ncbi:hypothetical protein [Photobacterium phosphoreum]|uniref:hypothetical protein n=1 Tax=Photobacterium phosphoreum TaxID=659 RepID=UPI0007F8D222|nr:hypothetical protein [Photobacterium phosphoreum]OBU35144.1 hypothetical protein AYY24_15900 [Photobacterium phosphoreum]PSW36866.1 hypothetical protein CTM87_11310 [Photobacterium phosphoreum]
MDFITSAIVGGVIYDLVKYYTPITVKTIGMKIADNLGINETISSAISIELAKIDYSSCTDADSVTSLIDASEAVQYELEKLNAQGSINKSVNNVRVRDNSGQVITNATFSGPVTFTYGVKPEQELKY